MTAGEERSPRTCRDDERYDDDPAPVTVCDRETERLEAENTPVYVPIPGGVQPLAKL